MQHKTTKLTRAGQCRVWEHNGFKKQTDKWSMGSSQANKHKGHTFGVRSPQMQSEAVKTQPNRS